MKRIILAALVGVLVSGPAWAETAKAVCPLGYYLNVNSIKRMAEKIKRCKPGSIILITTLDKRKPASHWAARLCRYDREIVISPIEEGITALSCIYAGSRLPDFWEIK